MRQIVVATMNLHNFIRKSNLVDPDFHSEENENERTTNEELPNTMNQDLSSRQYMEGVQDEIANII
ncbi:unnamed protein product [Eruca vesicaria subsp. sativa]|uniref:Uncharacterized protein n=1 Tax=Eruca vesicaria subsp. sativa TaxID=29727 RepID=A0ABC8LJ81_ERUVS|nr:unnamed protein product [Eruca vesicaria subsp. sativa]